MLINITNWIKKVLQNKITFLEFILAIIEQKHFTTPSIHSKL